MKKLILLLALSLNAEQPDIASYELTPPKTAFTYTALGPRFFGSTDLRAYLVTSADIAFGRRWLNTHHVLDYNFGAGLQVWQYAYGQVSYLYYPTLNKGPYFGIGFTGGAYHLPGPPSIIPKIGPFINIPATLGYQFSTKHDHQRFVQLQITPILSCTLSYGFEY